MVFQGLAVLFKPILALHIINFSSCPNYWGGGGRAKRYVCPPPIFSWGGGDCAPPPLRIDASVVAASWENHSIPWYIDFLSFDFVIPKTWFVMSHFDHLFTIYFYELNCIA